MEIQNGTIIRFYCVVTERFLSGDVTHLSQTECNSISLPITVFKKNIYIHTCGGLWCLV
uniref:Uncharacterized protein n=1 Tax=Anguilla anguilla TaxID=7936 RepID=A0A0E9XCV3_ANGAN